MGKPAFPKYAEVIVPRPLHQTFSYRIPAPLHTTIQVGHRVRIPFGRSTLIGVVVALGSDCVFSGAGDPTTAPGLRDIISVVEEAGVPLVQAEALDLVRYVSDRYCVPVGQCMRLIEPLFNAPPPKTTVVLTEAGRMAQQTPHRLSKRTLAILQRLSKARKGLSLVTLQKAVKGPLTAVVIAMKKHGLIVEEPTTPPSLPGRRKTKSSNSGEGLSRPFSFGLDEDKQSPLPVIPSSWQTNLDVAKKSESFSPLMVWAPPAARDGAILFAIEATVAEGRGVLLVAGDRFRAEHLAEVIQARWGDQVAILHGGLSATSRTNHWNRIQNGSVKIVVGTRSAIFAPLKSIGLICLEDEEQALLRAVQRPHYHAGELAWARAARHHALLLVGSSHPSVETLHAVQSTGHILTLPTQKTDWPSLQVVDLRVVPFGTVLSEPMVMAMDRAIRTRAGVVLFVNRKGFSSSLICRVCGVSPRCSHCQVVLTFFKTDPRLSCRYCGRRYPVPDTCGACTAAGLEPLGVGIERVEAEVRKHFPEVRIRRMDRESVSNESRAKTIRRSAWSGEAEVLLGTQLLFNGPPLPRVGMVGVPQADIGLHVPDFRAGERTYHALCRAMELCRPQEDGETEEGGTMVVQTFVPFHHAMAAIQAHDPSIFYHQELENRRPLGYPPFGSLIVLRVSGDDPARVEHASQHWRALLAENVSPESEAGRGTLHTMSLPGDLNFGSSLQIMGPIPSKEKLPRDRHRWQLLVKSAQGDLARRRVHDTLRELERSRKWAGMTFDVDVDSWEME